MSHVNPNRLGIVLAVMMVVVHGLWMTIVAAGAGQTVSDFVLRTHFVEPGTTVQPFSVAAAATLLCMAAAVGYATGAVAAAVWNGVSWLADHEWWRTGSTMPPTTTVARTPIKQAR